MTAYKVAITFGTANQPTWFSLRLENAATWIAPKQADGAIKLEISGAQQTLLSLSSNVFMLSLPASTTSTMTLFAETDERLLQIREECDPGSGLTLSVSSGSDSHVNAARQGSLASTSYALRLD